jgi:integrase
MAAAGVSGAPAMPRGLRHSFGVNAFQSNVPPNLVQRWLGLASLRTTSIYGDVIGPEERASGADVEIEANRMPRLEKAERRSSARISVLRRWPLFCAATGLDLT